MGLQYEDSPVRDYILCLDDQEWELLRLRQQLLSRFGERCVVDGLQSPAALCARLDELAEQDASVALLIVGGQILRDGGLEALIKLHQKTPSVSKLLLLSAPHDELLPLSVSHAGVCHYLRRPIEDMQLLLCVESILREKRLMRTTETLLTTLREQQKQLEAVQQDLDARVKERTRALEEANRRLSQLAATDGLTGLHNHRYLQEHLVLEVERSLRTGIPLGMLMVDVDHFRQYNNRFGHQTGDEVLRRVARLIAEHRRVNDVVARYGGEEFALLLINADHRVASNIGERLRARVAAERFPQTHDLPGGMLTISVGVASCPTDGTSAASLLQAADAALFRAKQSGRNRVCIAGEPPAFGENKAIRLSTARVSKSG
ncbi:MAG: GGDEF domain-containing protein [Myxococcales bacterium]|nr:GGDEF domain-containing protein [Myxococcales bacterium]